MASISSEQQLRFRWNDHMQHVSKVLTLQRMEEQFCDVTLVSEDGFVMKAHQAILASTSTYFQRVLSEVTSDQHPMIVLRGANFREISCLLDYMYQGNTQVDHSLMEKVLEVADMLEIKGLSRIRSNASIKKFMGPGPSPNSTNTASLNMPCTDNMRGSSRSPEEQFYRGNQPDTEGAQARLVGNVCDIRSSRETPHLPPDGPPMSRTQPHASHHESDPQDNEDVTQTSGIDLSMAKNEPWSPREGEAAAPASQKDDSEDDELSLSKKKRKHQENLCFEETVDPVSDPDWGRIGTKFEESSRQNPRTISLTSITTADTDLGHHHKSPPPPSKSEDGASLVLPLVEKTLEVPCEDGPLTISLTTGQDLDGWRSLAKRKHLFYTSLPLKRAKRKFKARRTLDEGRKKWLAKERRSLFGSESTERPITRGLERLKKKTLAPVLESMESVSVNCDPPFPTEEDTAKSNRDKENILSKSTPEENAKVQMAVKAAVTEHTQSNVWELPSDKRITNDKFEESSEDVKFPAINPLSLFTLPPVKEREKQTRTTLTLEEKVKVIETFLDGKSQRQIAHLYGIGKTQVSGIIKRREEILTIYRDSLLRGEKLTMKRHRKSEYALLNQHLIQWYRHMTVVAGVKITTGMLRAKALQIAPELGYHDFKASNGWLATFKSNNNLKFSKQRKPESYNVDQGNSQHDNSHGDDDESFFEDGETDNSSSHLPLVKHLAGPSNITTGATNDDGSNSDIAINRGSQNGESSSANPSDQGTSLIHPGLSAAGVPKPPQMVNASLGANLTAAAAYNLSRDLTRDLSRGDSTGVGDLSSATMNSSPLNHPVSALNVSRAVIDNPLSKPSDSALATYKSEEPLTYGYDPQNRMNDASSRGTEYNYTPYGFPGSYYGYHFLGQY
ncbi:uncharacterized protein LOC121857198 isoform X1 [Homarus americanus]|uniref:uncharacterized protein LOC121857198 isoform X1 n=1 Tax=Homarus americanus TaxID=6706 RepID=UPI001C48DB23|nr:uncharacterized protein LOC121857198 isoform X1 [Homarus americanus]XP_042209071.1 uncharacterized protein LOC121857198 isoform X1 [Homarus americanus]